VQIWSWSSTELVYRVESALVMRRAYRSRTSRQPASRIPGRRWLCLARLPACSGSFAASCTNFSCPGHALCQTDHSARLHLGEKPGRVPGTILFRPPDWAGASRLPLWKWLVVLFSCLVVSVPRWSARCRATSCPRLLNALRLRRCVFPTAVRSC